MLSLSRESLYTRILNNIALLKHLRHHCFYLDDISFKELLLLNKIQNTDVLQLKLKIYSSITIIGLSFKILSNNNINFSNQRLKFQLISSHREFRLSS